MTGADTNSGPKKNHGWLGFLIDFGPLLVFFLSYKFADPQAHPISAIITSTIAFMVATAIALVVSKWKLGKISPMLWLSAVLIMGFGALTVWLGDPTFIQIKPTIIYAFFAVVIFAGLLRGKPMLKYLLQSAFEGLDEAGWLKLSRNWGIFFIFLAILNEGLRAMLDFDDWLTAKTWGVTALSFLFTFAQIPILMRHGLGAEEADDVIEHQPHD